MVLKADPIGEADRRVVLLSAERGKISAFARGARRQGSLLMAATCPFCYGTFAVHFGRSSYYINSAKISDYFAALRASYEAAVYGMYLLEFADYCTRENNDEAPMLRLLYQALQALAAPGADMAAIRCAYELKAIALAGEYPGPPLSDMPLPTSVGEGLAPPAAPGLPAALAHIAASDPQSLYPLPALAPAALGELAAHAADCRRRFLDRPLRSEKALAELAKP
jgi:DNA repair protein RecO (recombination protein O)